jgi:ornithine lipid ester-linked acyl 2-hydroxylase
MFENTWLIERIFRPIFRRYCRVGDCKIFDGQKFSEKKILELYYPEIREELDKIMPRSSDFAPFQDISPDQIYISNDDKWKMYFLKAGNIRFERNCEEFPRLMGVLDKMPNIVSAYFSVLGPQKMLMPHEGPWCGVLRMHLGMIIPKPKETCALVVDGEKYHWEEGEVVVFDDTYNHFALNYSDEDRVILFLDVLRPLPWPLHQINKAIIWMARLLPYFKEPIKRHKKWEESFYGAVDEH